MKFIHRKSDAQLLQQAHNTSWDALEQTYSSDSLHIKLLLCLMCGHLQGSAFQISA